MKEVLNPKFRMWAYGVSAMVLVVLGVYGVIDGNQAAAFNLLFAALFGIAANNISSTPNIDRGKHEA